MADGSQRVDGLTSKVPFSNANVIHLMIYV